MSQTTDALLAAANPIDDDALSELRLDGAATDLRDAIAATPPTAPAKPHRQLFGRRRLPVLILATILVAGALAVAVTNLGSVSPTAPDDPGEAWAAEAVHIASAVPRLLPSEPGWKLTSGDQFSVGDGQVVYTQGERSLELRWAPRAQYASYLKDRQLGTKAFKDAVVNGNTAKLLRYEYPGSEDYAALWVTGKYFLEARTNTQPDPSLREHPEWEGDPAHRPARLYTGFTEGSFRSFLESLHTVGVDDWLSALPPSTVRPDAIGAEVSKMLDGVPVPQGFDRAKLIDASAFRDRYQLGARVTGAVMCSWFKEWRAAKNAGDAAGQNKALRAMSTAPSWAVFDRMGDEGAAPEFLTDDAVAFSKLQSPNKQVSIEAFYAHEFCQTM